MSRTLLLFLTLFPCFLTAQSGASIPRPKLVVGVVVDQMRAEYLYRFYDKFGEDGFKRILDGGFNCRNTHYSYIPTETGPGHATIYTGATPALHGIVSNNWFDRESGELINCVSGDPLSRPVGTDPTIGQVSARRLMTTTIADELKLFTQGRARVVTVGIKDRAAALSAGHMADGAYWLDMEQGHFVSSDYYVDALPEWATAFNGSGRIDALNQETWSTLFPVESYTEAGPDDSPHEYAFRGKEKAVFPYVLSELNGDLEAMRYRYLPYMPFGNTAVREMAQAAVKGEGLGQDDIPDLLGVNFSSVDFLGHLFGPNSVEMADMIVRLDREMAALLQFLDEEVGPGEYVLFLTADHGGMPIPRYLQERQAPGGTLPPAGLQPLLNQYLKEHTGLDTLVRFASVYEAYLDRERIAAAGLSLAELQQFVANKLIALEGIVAGYTATDLATRQYTEGIAGALQRGFQYGRSADVFLIPHSGYIAVSGPTRTGHGSPYTYDTHVPLLWYGWGIPYGDSVRPQKVVHIAPTLAHLLRIPLPSGSTPEVIEALFGK